VFLTERFDPRLWRNPSKSFHPGVSPVLPENINRDHGRLAISTKLSAAKTHSTTLLRPRGSVGISLSLSSRCSARSRMLRDARRSGAPPCGIEIMLRAFVERVSLTAAGAAADGDLILLLLNPTPFCVLLRQGT